MGDMRLVDGSGTGEQARIRGHRVHTAAITRTSMSDAADNTGYAFIYPINDITLPGTNEYAILRVKIADVSRHFHLERLLASWDGGSTNFNRVARIGLYRGMSDPSANYEILAAPASNFGLSLTSPTDVQRWDKVGNGMTVASNGTLLCSHYVKAGLSDLTIGGSIILAYGQDLSVTVKATEVGVLSFLMSGWFEEVHK